MRPIELAKIILEAKGIDFECALRDHLQNPLASVVMRPRCFAMGRAVEIDGKHAWHITVVAGDLREIVTLLPFKLPFISFYRPNGHNKLRVYPTERLLRRCSRQSGSDLSTLNYQPSTS